MDRNFFLILAGVIGILAIIFIAAGGKQESSNNEFMGDPLVVQADDYVQGEGTAGVTLIEYGDFSCPGCGLLFSAIQQMKSEYGDQVKFVFRHFPLEQLHPNALAAHRAAAAAGSQDMFWQMHDLLYANQNQWTVQASGSDITRANQVFESFANQLGLDIDQYNSDRQSEDTFNHISTHIDSGNQLGINGTPSLFLNGEYLETPSTYDQLKAAIDGAIATASAEQSAEPAPAN